MARRTDEELRRLALDVLNGNVVFSFQVPPQDVALHFMTLAFMSKEESKDMEERHVGAVYEYVGKALPMAINGLPVFGSHSEITEEELAVLKQFIKEAQDVQSKFLQGRLA